MTRTAAIIGTGVGIPPQIRTNDDLSKMIDTTDEWIRTRTGIRERRIIADGLATSDLGAEAASQALKNANVKPEEVDLIILATLSPDMITPSTACVVQHKIGAKKAGALDISAACSGFIYGLSLAKGSIVGGEAETALVIGAEATSRFMDWHDRANCVLFGDAAGAVVMRPSSNGHGVLGTILGADGAGAHLIAIEGGGSRNPASAKTIEEGKHFLKVKGGDVFKSGVRTMSSAVRGVLAKCGVAKEDVALLIPHQANKRIIDAIVENLEFPPDKVFINLDRYGNTSAATIPVGIHEALAAGRIKPGDLVCLVAFGGGLTWGAALLRW